MLTFESVILVDTIGPDNMKAKEDASTFHLRIEFLADASH